MSRITATKRRSHSPQEEVVEICGSLAGEQHRLRVLGLLNLAMFRASPGRRLRGSKRDANDGAVKHNMALSFLTDRYNQI